MNTLPLFADNPLLISNSTTSTQSHQGEVNNPPSHPSGKHNVLAAGDAERKCSVEGCKEPYKSRYLGTGLCSKHFSRQYTRDHRPAPVDPRYFLWTKGEAAVRDIFNARGRHVEDQPAKCKFDFSVDGYRIEVKTTSRSRRGFWYVPIQRNGILDEHTDFYVFRLIVCEGEAIHLLLKAPIGQKSLAVTVKNLQGKFSQAAQDFERFANGEFSKKSEAA